MSANQSQSAKNSRRHAPGVVAGGDIQLGKENGWLEAREDMCCIWINISDWEFDRIHKEIARLRSEGWELDEDGCSEIDRELDEEGGALALKFVRFSVMS